MTYRTILALLASIAMALGVTRPAQAQSSFSQEAAAEVLFRDAAKLFADGQLEEACDKFEASLELDHALGTLLRLADCHDRAGKTASAWAEFQEAAAMASAQQQPERQAIATERAEDLFDRLSYLSIEVADETNALKGVELLLNDATIPRASWGAPIPVNPGVQSLAVRAPGYEPWSTEVDVPETPGTHPTRVPRLTPSQASASDEAASGAKPTRRDSEYILDTPSESSAQRIWGYVSGGLGLAALGAGGYFTYRAMDLNEQSLDYCLTGEANACNAEGKGLRDDARSSGNIATIAAAAGFTLIGVSAVLLLTAPESESPVAGHVELRARANTAGGAVELGGTW